jgi:hypothetical protein
MERWIMSKIVIVILIDHCHKPTGHVLLRSIFLGGLFNVIVNGCPVQLPILLIIEE